MASVFSMIIAGDLPGHFVWQDDICVGLMTIAPIRQGHVLLIPREEIDHWHHVPAETLGHMMTVAKTIATAQQEAYASTRVGMVIAGLEVAHTHLHLIPMETMDDLDFIHAKQADGDALSAAAEKIKRYLP